MVYFDRSDDQRLVSVLYNMSFFEKAPGGYNVKANSRMIRQGDILAFDAAQDAATEKNLIVCKATLLAADVAAGAVTSISVRDAHPFKVGDSFRTQDTAAATVITGINYETNVISFASTDVDGSEDEYVRSSTQVESQAIGVALLPLMAENEHYRRMGLSPANDHLYGDIALTGLFKYNQLKNFETLANDQAYIAFRRIGSSTNSERAGVEKDVYEGDVYSGGDRDGVFGIYTPSQHFFV